MKPHREPQVRVAKFLSLSRRRSCIDHVRCKVTVSERRVYRVLGQHRSTQRRFPRRRADEERLVADMIELTRQYGRYGYRRVAASRDCRAVVEHLWRREGLKAPMKQPTKGRLWLNPSRDIAAQYPVPLPGRVTQSGIPRGGQYVGKRILQELQWENSG